jgi:Lon-like protease
LPTQSGLDAIIARRRHIAPWLDTKVSAERLNVAVFDEPSINTERPSRHPFLTLLGMALLLFALLMPLPYVVVSPGPATDTLGKVGSTSLITIEGAKTYPTEGALMLTTVSVSDPKSAVRGGLVLEQWVRPRQAILPRSTFYPDDQDAGVIQQRDAEAMELSQQNATTAALTYLGYDLPSTIRILRVLADTPAEGVLKAGDEVLTIDGKAITSVEQVPTFVRDRKPGTSVRFTVRRAEKTLSLTTDSIANPDGAAFVGFAVVTVYEYPFEVKIRLDDVGGPSAGLMFALGIVEKLGPESLTQGRRIAGTGTIDDNGRVGAIGGIVEKLQGARKRGATLFLAPAKNCEDITYIPDGLTVVPVNTLAEAIKVLQQPSSTAYPTCRS